MDSKITLSWSLKIFCLFSFYLDAPGNFAKAIEMSCVESDGKSSDEFGKSLSGTASVVDEDASLVKSRGGHSAI